MPNKALELTSVTSAALLAADFGGTATQLVRSAPKILTEIQINNTLLTKHIKEAKSTEN
jgi:hypothetical protein